MSTRRQTYSTSKRLMIEHYFVFSLDSQIKESVQELGSLLARVKGGGQVSLSQPSQRNNIQQESEMILQPLMDFLDGR